MTVAEVKVLLALSAANGRPLDPEKLKQQTGLADTELQMVVSSIGSKGWARVLSGGEQAGQKVRFYNVALLDSGAAALLPHMNFANKTASATERWDIEQDIIEQVNNRAEAHMLNGEDPLLAVGKAFRDMALDRQEKPK